MNTYLESIKEDFEVFFGHIIHNLPNILVGIVLLSLFILVGYHTKRIFTKVVMRRAKDELFIRFLGNLIKWIIIAVGVVMMLNQMGLSKAASGILTGAGVSAIIIGFAFKEIGENLLSGIYLALSRPFETGDLIRVSGLEGTVKSIQLRSVYIRTFSGEDIFIPNSMIIKNPVTNLTKDGLRRWDITVGLDYDDNIEQAIEKINESLLDIKGIETGEGVNPFTSIDTFGSSTINLKVFFWTNQIHMEDSVTTVLNRVKLTVLRVLQSNNFYMPSDIVELKLYQQNQPFEVSLSNNEKSLN